MAIKTISESGDSAEHDFERKRNGPQRSCT